jgi:hypothetical protein
MDALYIGRKILTNEMVLRTIYYTSQNFISLFSNIKLESQKKDSSTIMTDLNSLDIENYISIVESFLSCIELEKASQPIHMSIYNVKRTISDMYYELDTIYKKIKYNNSLWMMPTMRSYDCTGHITNLKCLKHRLEDRFELLMKLTNLFPKCLVHKSVSDIKTIDLY